MSISFESAVATLKSMFPEWDEETLSTILMSNNYHVEQTIETVLSMGDTTGADSQSRGSTSSPQTAPYAAPAPAPAARHQSPPAQRAPSSSSSGNPRNRGLKCDLPDDFLRPPNWQSKHTILADEELALMLQNEMFQAEARRVLGEDFMREAYGEDYAVGSRPAGPRRTASGRPQSATAQQDGDLGIVKALGSMGAAAKRSLTQLAQRFNNTGDSSHHPSHYPSGNQPHGTSTGVSRGGIGGGSTPGQTVRRRGSGTRRKGAFNDLEDDDEEGTEIITFSSNGRSQHMLQGGGASSGAPPAYADGEEDDGEDSANPLLARQTTNQVI